MATEIGEARLIKPFWRIVWEWATFSFGNAKALSDFVGFHVRALFCFTLAILSLFPSIDALIQSTSSGEEYLTPYTSPEGWVQFIAFTFFSILFALLLVNIFRSVYYCFITRPYSTGNPAFKMLSIVIGIPLTLGIWILEAAAFIAIIWRVLMTILFALIATDAEREAINEKLCIIKPFADRTGLPIYPEPTCSFEAPRQNGEGKE